MNKSSYFPRIRELLDLMPALGFSAAAFFGGWILSGHAAGGMFGVIFIWVVVILIQQR